MKKINSIQILIFTIIILLDFLVAPNILQAQGIKNNGASIVVKQGAEVVIDGNDGGFTNQAYNGSNGEVFLNGQISVRGNWLNNAGGNVFVDPDETGLVVFGPGPLKAVQQLGGTGATRFENLTVNSGATAKIVAGAEIRVMYNFILNGTLDIYGDLYIEGTFTYNGQITGTGTVHYESTEPQLVAPGNYPNLVLDNPGGLILTDEVYVESELVLSQGSLVLGENNLVLGPNCVVVESKAPGAWIDATGTGMVIKLFDQVGTFEFPVGNFGSNPVYSPVTVELLSANFNDGQISVRLKPETHPETGTGADFPNHLSRYWVVESEGLSDVSYNIRFNYDVTDVTGDEGGIEGAKFVPADGFWKHFGHVNAEDHYFEISGLNSFSDFTGVMENRAPVVSITHPANGSSIYDTTITISGTASDVDGDLVSVLLRINENNWTVPNGKENWTLKIPLSFGNRKIEAKAVDYQDAVSAFDESSFYTGVMEIMLYDRWSHISAFLDPIDGNFETILALPINNNILNVLNNEDGDIFWPSQNINTIGEWTAKKAYQVNILEEASILFKGDLISETSLELETGYSYLPVLSNVPTQINDAFSNPEEDILIVFNHQTNEIFWPDGGIYTLDELDPGSGYLTFMNNPATVSYADYDLVPVPAKPSEPKFPEPGPWPLARTADVHLISVFHNAIAELGEYSYVGAFNTINECIGFTNISKSTENELLVIYGDDEYTAYKDGAEYGESISFRGYNPTTGLETELIPVWNPDFRNHDGYFAKGGLSAISGFKEGQTGIGQYSLTSELSIYPNPASFELNIVIDHLNLSDISKLKMVNTSGSTVIEQRITQKHTKLDIRKLEPGVYILEIKNNGLVAFEKVIIK